MGLYKLMIGVFLIFGVECSLYKLMIGVFVTFVILFGGISMKLMKF